MKKTAARDIIVKTEAYCEEHGLRFTDPRRMVLEIIAAAEKPLGAYDILALIGKKIDNPKPPTVYRAIEFLSEHQIIHRIESLNAYILCQSDHRHEGSQFMICDDCGTVTEAHLCDLPAPLSSKTKQEGFELSSWNVELHGTCRNCSKTQHVHTQHDCGCGHH